MMSFSKRTYALIAATAVAVIYGVTFTVAKDVMPLYLLPFGFIVLRVSGSTILFWLTWWFGPKEKMDKQDYLRIAGAGLFGVALNMLTFFKGLSMTSQISAAVLMVTTPMIVLVLSAFLLKEKLKSRKIIGILLGLFGTILLIAYGKKSASGTNENLGNLLVFINAVSYGFYLIMVKKLMDKYNAFSFVPWIYTAGLIMVLPFGWQELSEVAWHTLPTDIWYKVVFVVVFSTFLTYLLNLVSMRELKPTTVSVFIYLQPLFATIFAVALGKDQLDQTKLLAAAFIFIGVYLVTIPKKN
jgi:drug/metabolite transporter (DMT)-like permease